MGKFEKMLRSTAYKKAGPRTKILMMLEFKGLDELVKLGHVFDVEAAARTLGKVPWSVRRYCREAKIGYFLIGRQYYFLPGQILEDIKFVERRA